MRESFSAHPDNEERPRLSELIQSIDPVGRKTRIVAIDGHGGSGKSELARQLAGALEESAIVHTDDFARSDVPGWDWQRMRKQVLDRILNDQTARYQRYDWDSNRLAESRDIGIGGTLIVEGVSSLRQELGEYWDFAIWVDAPYEIRLRRGVDRDGEQMRSQWTDIWMPEEAEYVKAHRPEDRADFIADGTKPFSVGNPRSRSARSRAGCGGASEFDGRLRAGG